MTEPSPMCAEVATEERGVVGARAGLGTKGWAGRGKDWAGGKGLDPGQWLEQEARTGCEDSWPVYQGAKGWTGQPGQWGDGATFLRPMDRAGQCSVF